MFSAALLDDVVSAAHPAISILVSNTSSPYYSYLNGVGQRLERHIADIHKGFAVIIVSGKPSFGSRSLHLDGEGCLCILCQCLDFLETNCSGGPLGCYLAGSPHEQVRPRDFVVGVRCPESEHWCL